MQIYAEVACQEEEELSLCINVVEVGAELNDPIQMGRRVLKSSRRHSRSCQIGMSRKYSVFCVGHYNVEIVNFGTRLLI
jgi:hypothetical protein